jgi:transposase
MSPEPLIQLSDSLRSLRRNSKLKIQFAHKFQLTIQLAYYPPYHSKYNPVERAFGWLEQHWCGSLLDTVDTILRFASSGT